MQTGRPNILLITSDQQHWNTLGHVNPAVKTPNLDRLAAEGTRFGRAYCVNPTCTPTRASMITGLYPSQHGAWSLGHQAAGGRADGWGLSDAGRLSHGTRRKGALPAACVNAGLPIAGIVSGQCRTSTSGGNFHGPFYGFEHVELARNHVDECARRPALRAVDGGEGLRELAGLLPAARQATIPTRSTSG